MSEQGQNPGAPGSPARQPVFLLPGAVTVLAGLLIAIHLASTLVLNEEGQIELMFWFAFQPYRIVLMAQDPGLAVPLLWTPFTHALLHAGWDHLLFNTAWLVIFATPVARRYGAGTMLSLFLVSAGAGAALVAASTPYEGNSLNGDPVAVAG